MRRIHSQDWAGDAPGRARMRGSAPHEARWAGACLALFAACALPAQVVAHAYTAQARVHLQRGAFLRPQDVIRLEVAGAADAMEAWAGKRAWPLVQDPHKDVLVLVLNDDLRGAWTAAGTLYLGYATQRASGGELALRASPRRLELDPEGHAFTLVQRRAMDVPGTQGYLRVGIGDITGGQASLRVQGTDGHVFVADRSVRAGDALEIDLGEARYVLVIRRLRNVLIGDDHAELQFVPAERYHGDRIEELLRRVAAADVTFLREGKEHTAAEAAAHLRAKREAAAKTMTVEQFITEIGSRSSLTGSPYEVRARDGSTESAADWLRREAEAAAREAAVKTSEPRKE